MTQGRDAGQDVSAFEDFEIVPRLSSGDSPVWQAIGK
jgi:hypothetical protein